MRSCSTWLCPAAASHGRGEGLLAPPAPLPFLLGLSISEGCGKVARGDNGWQAFQTTSRRAAVDPSP